VSRNEDALPSPWVVRWAGLIPPGGNVLDLACGGGRHARHLARLGHPVVAVDIDPPDEILAGVTWRQCDLEGDPWPFAGQQFAGIVVVNYLHRPLFAAILQTLAPGGVLIYETFALGQEKYGRPTNPNFLLLPGELLELVCGRLRVVAYEDVLESGPPPSRRQRLCAVRN
jgi:SAM-dependent methyltransferase